MPAALTAPAVERIKPDPAKRLEKPDGILPGFYLVVQPSGAKSWAVRYRVAGKPRKHTIGSYPAIGLADARDLARKALSRVAAGGDPSAEKIAKRAAENDSLSERDLMRTLVAEFLEKHAKKFTRDTSWRMTDRLLQANVVPAWGQRRVQDITRRDVIDLLDKIVDRGAPVLANRVLAAVRKMFNWLRSRSVIEANPCDGVKAPTPEKSRDRVLSDDELRLVWIASASLGPPFHGMICLLILTGQRLREVSEMTDLEVDYNKGLWTIPRSRAKNDFPHDVPLSDAALAELRAAPRIKNEKSLIFCTNGRTPVSGYSKAKSRLDAKMLAIAKKEAEVAGGDPQKVLIPHWTFHDLRRTMASGMARLGINLPVVEKVLNHVSGSFGGIVGVYQRHSFADEKRAALDVWANHVLSLSAGEKSR